MKFTIIEFIGGAWDGMNLCDGSPDPIEAALACHVLKATDDGTKGSHAISAPSRRGSRHNGNTILTEVGFPRHTRHTTQSYFSYSFYFSKSS
jgi:hypothetical protein